MKAAWGYIIAIAAAVGTVVIGVRSGEPCTYFIAVWAAAAAVFCGLAWGWDRRHKELEKQFQDYVKKQRGEE